MATIILKPTSPLPSDISLAFLSSETMAEILAAFGFLEKISSLNPICAADISPMPPYEATCPARFERLIPTPIPP